ncbi:MAG: histidine kinase [Chitinophagaceae bacterium]|nr:histidine kinase [Chitinophagaceae bacterium]MBP6430761.1 histidine kinase [Ferruginibacter sp.]
MSIKKIIIKWVIIGCIILQPICLFAQPYNFTTYTEANGLPSGYIERVFEDSKGYLWICTYGGLSRFDGRNFKNYDIKDGLPGNFCDEIFEDKIGNLWICTRKGISCFNGKTFTNYLNPDTLASTYTAHPSINQNNQFSFVLNGKNAFIQKNKIQFNNELDSFKNLPTTKFTVATLQNNLKIINTNLGLFTLLPNKQPVKILNCTNNINVVFVHPSEINAFYFVNQHGVFHWQNNQINKLSTHNFSKSLCASLFVDDEKKIWVGCEDEGVWLLQKNTSTLIKNELPGLLVPSFYQDKFGTIWICTFRGLVKLTPKCIQHFNKQSGLVNEDIRSSQVLINSTVLMQTALFKNNELTKLPQQIQHLATNFYKDFVSTIFLDFKNKWWIFADHAIYTYNNNRLKNITPQLKPYSCRNAILCKKDSSIWFANSNIIYCVKNGSISKTISTLSNGKPLSNVVYFYSDFYGNIWIAEKERLLLYNNQSLIDFTPNLQLPSKTLAQVCYSNQLGFWIRTQGFGALHFLYTKNGFVKDKFINTDNGLTNNFVHDIKVDDYQNVWVATLNGLYRVKENELIKNTYSVKYFTKTEDGLDVTNWNLAFLEKDANHNIWLGTANGVYKINSNKIIENTSTPQISIQKIAVINNENGNKPFLINPDSNNVVFTANQNDITFNYNGINIQSAFIQYSYMLKGKDNDWINNKNNEQISYYNLPPGKYTFMVKAINEAGIHSKTATYSFTIIPPFWQQWWFRILLILTSVLLLYTYIIRREKLKEKENKIALQMSELKLTALQSQMNPHFIFNSLNSIQNYILQQKPIEAARYLSKFSKLMRRILDQSFDNFTPLNEIVETLKMYLELEAFRFSNEFTWQVKVDNEKNIANVKLPAMLLQPFVENAIIHGLMPKIGNKNLLIHLYKKSNTLHCIIEDDGIGRQNELQSKTHISRGQKLTADMLATIENLLHTNAEIIITDKINQQNLPIGTIVNLIIPLTN